MTAFIVQHAETGRFLSYPDLCQSKADALVFDTEDEAQAEITYRIQNDRSFESGTYRTLPYRARRNGHFPMPQDFND